MTEKERDTLLWCCSETEKAQNIVRRSCDMVEAVILPGKHPRQLKIPTSFGSFLHQLDRIFWEEHNFKAVYEVVEEGDRTWLLGEYKNHTASYLFARNTEGLVWESAQ